MANSQYLCILIYMKGIVGISFTNTTAYGVHAIAETTLLAQTAFSASLKTTNFFESFVAVEERQITETAQLFKKIFEQYKLLDLNVQVVIPDDLCSLQVLRLPIVSEKEIVSVIEFQAEEFIPYPIKSTSIDYQILSIDEKEQKMSVLVVASLTNLINKISDTMLEAGLYPGSIEPESTVLYRLLLEGYCQNQQDLTLLLNIGEKNTQASLLDIKNKVLIMTHNFNLGISFFLKALQYNLNLSLQDSIDKFVALSTTEDVYLKVMRPLVLEYAKEVEKIFSASQEKLGMLPKTVTVFSSDKTNLLVSFLQEVNAFPSTPTIPIQLIDDKISNAKIKFAQNFDRTKTDLYLLPLGALI